ncbi:MAG: Hsp70 family protein [Actinomycetota bacterium]|nr:Hsp70 family protein [Actinomycetota bacterium]
MTGTANVGYHLGIDLGTTNTVAAVSRAGATAVVQLSADSHALPSVATLRDDSTVLVGEAAVRRALTEPTRVAREFKRRFGDAAPIVLGGKRTSAEALTTGLLTEVLRRVEETEGGPPTSVTLTHPAAWGPFRIEKLREAAAAAGLADVHLLPEPVAAALGNADRVRSAGPVAIYDLGGGTFDAAVVTLPEGTIVGTPEGVERLGGADIDALVMAHVDDAVGGQVSAADISEPDVRAGIARLQQECRAAKEVLSTDTETDVSVSLPGCTAVVRLTRGELESMVRSRLTDTLAVLDRVVTSAGPAGAALQGVLLVGGSSRMPLVAQMVREHIASPLVTTTNPGLAIALGAAVHGAALAAAPPQVAPTSIDATSAAAPAPAPSAPDTPKSRTRLIVAAAVLGVFAIGGATFALVGGDDTTDSSSTTLATTVDDTTSATGTPDSTSDSTSDSTQPSALVVDGATLTTCTDPERLLADATAVAVDLAGGRIAIGTDSAVRIASVSATGCAISTDPEFPDPIAVDTPEGTNTLMFSDGLLLVAGSGGGSIIDLDDGTAASCPLFKAEILRFPKGLVMTFNAGERGYDTIDVTTPTCTIDEEGKFPLLALVHVASVPDGIFVAGSLLSGQGEGAVSRLEAGESIWDTGAAGTFGSFDGLAVCGDFVCVLDLGNGDLVRLSQNSGAELARTPVAELGLTDPTDLDPASGWILSGAGTGVRLTRIDITD